MKIIWHKRAADALRQVEVYVLRTFGEKARQEWMDEMERTIMTLAAMPEQGRLDPLFAHRKKSYRSIIVRRLNKIIYYTKGDTIHIAAFWDTRREPQKQAEQTK